MHLQSVFHAAAADDDDDEEEEEDYRKEEDEPSEKGKPVNLRIGV